MTKKKIQSYTNDFVVHHVEAWFKEHETLTKKEYRMLVKMVCHIFHKQLPTGLRKEVK